VAKLARPRPRVDKADASLYRLLVGYADVVRRRPRPPQIDLWRLFSHREWEGWFAPQMSEMYPGLPAEQHDRLVGGIGRVFLEFLHDDQGKVFVLRARGLPEGGAVLLGPRLHWFWAPTDWSAEHRLAALGRLTDKIRQECDYLTLMKRQWDPRALLVTVTPDMVDIFLAAGWEMQGTTQGGFPCTVPMGTPYQGLVSEMRLLLPPAGGERRRRKAAAGRRGAA
jgi:hypothetical protein